jgi:hypothetical protein
MNNREEVILDLRVQLSQALDERDEARGEIEASKAYTTTVARAWARVADAIREQVASGKLEMATLQKEARKAEATIRKAEATREKVAKKRGAAGRKGGEGRRESRLWDAATAKAVALDFTKDHPFADPKILLAEVMGRIELNVDGGPHPKTVLGFLRWLWTEGKLSDWSPIGVPQSWRAIKKPRKTNK